jgi:hypothetical protein
VRRRKDEGHRLGDGSFKALGSAYTVIQLLLAEARQTLGRAVDISELHAGRGIVVRSFEQSIYEPRASADWDAAIDGFDALVSATR